MIKKFNKILEWFGVVKCSHDPFRPTTEPARTLYDAFVMESGKRRGKESEEWVKNERLAVYNAALNWCLKNEYDCPTIKDLIEL